VSWLVETATAFPVEDLVRECLGNGRVQHTNGYQVTRDS